MSALPFMLEMRELSCVVVGGGEVACRRIKPLLEAGARELVVVAPTLNEELLRLQQEDGFKWERRSAVASEVFLCDMVFLCTDQPDLHSAIKKNKAPRQFVYLADDAGEGNFYIPARINDGLLTVSVSTAGASPSYTKRVKEAIEHVLPRNAGDELAFLQEARGRVIQMNVSKEKKLALLKELATSEFLQDERREERFEEYVREIGHKK
ncbi:bifunctional precorrin-2 dehydrogenase/sirohydrochlorin ferrochelatase [Salicibibacter cibarius]|uniref:precorrin-2 dehydrogenase n=1 Tax=Salicibibacter cibarius TaxID=2743000 RepID=A0A7T6Z0Q3_9BACI|nr:bifunctional precorrin-2 dehydrogenase/sirohydrochlorin ferrochelatase [Salicibibacter cibarius]QQK74769.1 bifunctional precorrin-2 dehydrogenase/sirohydrochlorin ferrochelatase [Salicibibacter cibarius]